MPGPPARAPAPLRPVPMGTWFHVRLEDRLDQQFCGGLHHPVPTGDPRLWGALRNAGYLFPSFSRRPMIILTSR